MTKSSQLSLVATQRFKTEVLRTYNVIEIQLSGKHTGQEKKYLAGKGKGKYSVADIGAWRRFLFSLNTKYARTDFGILQRG
jgi:hypothetical protein